MRLVNTAFRTNRTIYNLSAMPVPPTAVQQEQQQLHCEAKKTAPFYFCDSFVRTSSFMTMFGTRIHQ